MTGSFLNGLNASLAFPSSTPLVPKLTDLKLVVHGKDLASDTFLKMLSSRWLPEPCQATEVGAECLRFVAVVVILDEETDQKGGHLDCLDCLKDSGMGLAVTYGTLAELYPEVDSDDKDEE